MGTQNLWPDFKVEKIRTPKSILKEQAAFLSEKTDGVLSAEVRTKSTTDTDAIYQVFTIIAPALGNYRFRLLNVWHSVDLYPVKVCVLGDELIQADNEEEFIEAIRKIFNNQETVKIISSLLEQSTTD